MPVILVGFVGAGDAARLAFDVPWIANINYMAAWAAIHQIGFAWRDEMLPTRSAAGVLLAAVGLGVLALLTIAGPYPVSMVGLPGETLQNTEPPTLALIALAIAQVGVALSLRERSSKWLRNHRPWVVVVAINSVIMTIFLWHMSAAVVAVLTLYGGGIIPVAAVGSAEWLMLRVPWLVACAFVLAGLVATFARIERATPGVRKGARVGSGVGSFTAMAGLSAVIGGMVRIATSGPSEYGALGLPTEALLGYFGGVVLLAVAIRAIRRHAY